MPQKYLAVVRGRALQGPGSGNNTVDPEQCASRLVDPCIGHDTINTVAQLLLGMLFDALASRVQFKVKRHCMHACTHPGTSRCTMAMGPVGDELHAFSLRVFIQGT